jgi:drug/metabolite transporter (DMT)-like permease
MLIMLGVLIFALNDVIVRLAGANIDPVQMTFFRYATGTVLLTPLFLRAGADALKTRKLGLHIGRAIIASIAQAGAFYAVVHLYLADATAISFSRPLFMTFLAVVILGEVVGWRRWMATAAGFIGVIVMVRPGQSAIHDAWMVALASALVFALALILIRKLSATEPPIRILFYYQLSGLVVFIGPAAWVWKAPTWYEWPMLLTIGVLTTLAMVCFVRGYAAGEASILGPMEYTRLIFAALLGFFVFVEVPSVWTWIGAAIIVASTIYIARVEAFAKPNATRKPPSA